MAPRGLIALTAVLLCFVLVSLTPPAQGLRIRPSCCTSYQRRPIPFQFVTGYREQSVKDGCRLDAIIFYTTKKTKVCTSEDYDWVKRLLKRLSNKLNKMSKGQTATTAMKSRVTGTEGGSLFSTTEPNNSGDY